MYISQKQRKTKKINQYIARTFQGLNTKKGVFKAKAELFNSQKPFQMSMKWRTAETHGNGMCQQLTVLMTLVLSIRRTCLFTYISEAKHSQPSCDAIPHKLILGCILALVLGLSRVSSKSISLSCSFHSNKFHLSMNSLK